MKVGVHFNWQNYTDWPRYLAKDPLPPKISDQEIYEEEMYLAGLVEPLGFDSYWAIDHHFSPYSMTGGALQHLTYFAGKTSKIDFGTMIVVLPWYDPLVVIDQIAVLDNLLQGRQLTLGLGRGAGVREFDPFRVPMGEARDRFNESLEIMRKAMTNEWFSHDGQFYKIPETTIRPMFRNPERLMERMRVAWSSPETLPLTANNGLGMLMTNQKSWDAYKQDVADFNNIRIGNGQSITQPSVVVKVACFEDEAEAWELMRRHVPESTKSSKHHYQFGDVDRFKNTKGYEQYAAIGKAPDDDEHLIKVGAEPQAWGTPDQVFEKLRHIQSMTAAEEFILNVKFGTMPAEKAEESMRRFAEKVLPRLHDLEATMDPSILELTRTEKATMGEIF
ncbi:LLM class flavin-dependent oxidoreductase [Rhodococcus sp. KBS0724]|uniref:LLM class flavin-dependent oxidoreductase n=1 Tax=Rhodococcus sp. KBS0724 TaxID=1179674 RepID=UPI00110DEA53|nr:LLM class flavin-dependent oxidoreductase [Rhodococcus sp. KBS0724]TSD40362.1 LLM class flavin-dependent oxidoreductase [Rhodococcus sp. KBS0724]